MKDLLINLQFDATELMKALEEATYTFQRFVDVLLSSGRELTSAGLWAYNIARFVGFLPEEVIAWLETCPGAFEDEFGEGYDWM